jgi:hypothetical protein
MDKLIELLSYVPLPSGSTIHFFLLFSFQFSFFLWTKVGLFLLFPFAFIFLPFIAHIYFSFLENDLFMPMPPNFDLGGLKHSALGRTSCVPSREWCASLWAGLLQLM